MCYTVPLATFIVLNGVKRAKKVRIPYFETLNLLFLGGSVMLVVDHFWNGELFLIGENIVKDLLLGVAMTLAVFSVWGLIILKDKRKAKIISLEKA